MAGMAGMLVAGIAGGGLVAWFTGDRFLNSDVDRPVIVLQSTLLTLVVAIALWRTRKRGWRAFAAGLAACWALVVLAFGLLWALSDDEAPGLADDAGTPGYYLGEEIDGLPVNQTRPVAEIEATGVGVGYGQPCPGIAKRASGRSSSRRSR